MAASVVGTGGTNTSASDPTIAFTLPASIPNNSKLLFVTNGNVSTDTVTSVSGVTETQVGTASPGTTLVSYLFEATVGSADQSATVTVNWSGSGKHAVAWIVVSGVELTIDAQTNVVDNTVDTSATLPSITPVVANTFLVSLVSGQHPTASTTFTKDADYTLGGSSDFSGTAPQQSAKISYLQLATGAGVPRSGDIHTWSLDSRDVCWQVTLAPLGAVNHAVTPTEPVGTVDAKSFVTNFVTTADDSTGLTDTATPVLTAIATVVGSGAAAGSSPGTTIAFTLPASIPENSTLLFCTNNNTQSGTVTDVSNVAETQLDLQRPNNALSAYLFKATVGSANNGQIVTITWSASSKIACAWVVVSGVRTTVNALPLPTLDGDGADTIAVIPTVMPTVANTFLVSLVSGQHGTGGTTFTKDADYILDGSAFYSGTTPLQSSHVGHLQLTTDAGVERSGDQHDWSAASREVSWVVALQADVPAAFKTYPTDSTGLVESPDVARGVTGQAVIAFGGTFTASGVVGTPATVLGAAVAAFGFAGTASGVVQRNRFSPPTHEEPMRTNRRPLSRYRLTHATSIVRINGVLTPYRNPSHDMLRTAGVEGVDWFIGGNIYFVSSATATELTNLGYQVVLV